MAIRDFWHDDDMYNECCREIDRIMVIATSKGIISEDRLNKYIKKRRDALKRYYPESYKDLIEQCEINKLKTGGSER